MCNTMDFSPQKTKEVTQWIEEHDKDLERLGKLASKTRRDTYITTAIPAANIILNIPRAVQSPLFFAMPTAILSIAMVVRLIQDQVTKKKAAAKLHEILDNLEGVDTRKLSVEDREKLQTFIEKINKTLEWLDKNSKSSE